MSAVLAPVAYRLPFDRDLIPRQLRRIPDQGHVKEGSTKAIVWGWQEWIAIHRRVRGHIRANGRHGLPKLICEMQSECIAPHLQRPLHSIQVALSPKEPGKGIDAMVVFDFLANCSPSRAGKAPATPVVEMPPKELIKQIVEASNEQVEEQRSKERRARREERVAANYLVDVAQVPVGAFLPLFKRLLVEAFSEALKPQKEELQTWIREAIEQTIGGPPQTPQTSQTTLQTEAKPAVSEATTQAKGTSPDVWVKPLADAAFLKLFEVTGPPPKRVPRTFADTLEHPPVVQETPQETPEALHDMRSQMAKALGINPNHVEDHKKRSILVVGLHHHVEQEVRKHWGHAFRFVFKNCDDFKCAGDVPASTDAILISRKRHVSSDIVALSRRYSMPMEHVANTSAAVKWALQQHFPEAQRLQ